MIDPGGSLRGSRAVERNIDPKIRKGIENE